MTKENGQSQPCLENGKITKELKALGLQDSIVSVLVGENSKPEGKIRVQWVIKLIKEYRFPASQIDINVAAGVGRDAGKRNAPVRADIVVYRDANKTKPFAVVETKAPRKKEGLEQAESYSRNLGSEYHLWSDGSYECVYKTSRYAQQSEAIARLPIWVTDKPLPQKVPKTETLRPFKDEEELRQVISFCHDLILEKIGHDPAKAFDEMTKLLFIKVYDEREVPSFYEFAVLANEIPHDVADRIRKLFDKAISSSKYRDVFWSQFNSIPVPVTLELDDFSIFNIVQVLQGYSLVNTTENIHGADIKGTVYEQMVGSTFRGELAQFFTPRELVDFMVDVIRPDRESTVLDPACGSGGFLIMTLRKLREWIKQENPNLNDSEVKASIKYFAEHKTFGIDINDRMVRVAKMNMIMHGDGHSGIFHILRGGGLLTDDNLPENLKELIEGKVDIVFSNPPFAGREKDPSILRKFDLGVNKEGETISVSKEVLFIEVIIKLLKENGRAGLVLPSGIFNNKSMANVRKYIKDNCKLLALIALPSAAFIVSGANNEGNLLFIQKKKKDAPEQDYDIFIDWARDVGFDATGRKYNQNDLPQILERSREPPQKNIIKFSELAERIDPWYYHPTYIEIEKHIEKMPFKKMRLTDVFTSSKELVSAEKEPQKLVRYIETNDVDLIEGKIKSWQSLTIKELPNRATYILKEGDILIPNHRHCIRGVATVTKEEEGMICSNRFHVVRPKMDLIRPTFLIRLLRQPETLLLMIRNSTGEINPTLNWWGLKEVKVPIPDLPAQDKILDAIRAKEEQLTALKQELEVCTNRINEGFRKDLSLYSNMIMSDKLGSEQIADVKMNDDPHCQPTGNRETNLTRQSKRMTEQTN